MNILRTALVAVLLALSVALALGGAARLSFRETTSAPPQGASYQVVRSYPHDRNAFTQGLIYLDGYLYESTGLNGRSTVRKVELETGKVLQEHRLESRYFGEGLTHWGGALLQLTWQANLGFVYDRSTFRTLRTFSYRGEGWGLTQDGKRLILSDGTAALRFLDPQTFQETGRITVRDGVRLINNLNELEFIRGEVYANVWGTDRIARISPETGAVLGWVDLTGLLPASQRANSDAVLNGIAYDAGSNRLFVTGKLWPTLFEIRIGRND